MHKKRYVYSIIEQAILNSRYHGYRGGRVEIFDRRDRSGYPVMEANFLIPEEFMDGFINLFDEKSSNVPVIIDWHAPPGHHHNR